MKVLVTLLLATLLLIAAPARIASAQGQPSSTSSAEVTRLKTALSGALDRIEDDNARIASAEEYVKKLEAESQESEKLIAGSKEELARLYRLRELDKEEADKLRSAITRTEEENKLLRETVSRDDAIIIKQNQKLSSSRKLMKILFGVGVAIGLGAGLKIGR